MPWNPTTVRTSGFLLTAAVWNDELVENMAFLEEVAYEEFTSTVNVTATTDATAQSVVSAGAIVLEAVPHLIEFEATYASPDSAAALREIFLTLWDGSTDLGRIARVRTPAASTMHACHGKIDAPRSQGRQQDQNDEWFVV